MNKQGKPFLLDDNRRDPVAKEPDCPGLDETGEKIHLVYLACQLGHLSCQSDIWAVG